MKTIGYLLGLAMLLAACSASMGYPEESSCSGTPPKSGETQACAYYPGYGWAHVPVYHVITLG
jgi:hypothetical protein